MKTLIKQVTTVLALILLATVSFASANINAVLTEGEAVNRAGQQRMLSQRMAKSWVLLAQHSTFSVQKTQLLQSMQRFEDNLQQLQAYDAQQGGALQQPLLALSQQWSDYRGFLMLTPAKSRIPMLLERSEQTLQKAEAVVQTMMSQSKNIGLAEVVAVSGRQRMLSQRIVLLYGVSSSEPDQARARAQAIANFGQALQRLQGYAGNTPEIQKKLQDVMVRWNFAQHVFSQPKSLFRVLDATCEQLLTEMDQVTTLYAALKSPVALPKLSAVDGR